VRSRQLGDRVLHAGVFGTLPVGPYDLRLRPSGSAWSASVPFVTVAVADGTVVETSLTGSDERD
jgi:hypothetical protein